jgi:hypothetical protein
MDRYSMSNDAMAVDLNAHTVVVVRCESLNPESTGEWVQITHRLDD